MGKYCNNSCVFCQDRSTVYLDEVTLERHVESLEKMRSEFDSVVFVGGEPTLSPILPDLIDAAHTLKYGTISLITNGRPLHQHNLAVALLARGLNDIIVSIHGPDARSHDAIVRRNGAFEQTTAGVKNLVALRHRFSFALCVNCTIVCENLEKMRQMRDFAVELGANSINFNVVEPRGYADDHFASVVPSYAQVMHYADESGLDFGESTQSLARVPPCAGGVEWVQVAWHLARHDRVAVFAPSRGKTKGPVCASCALDDCCEGIWKRYIAHFGWDELIPVVDPATRVDQTLRVLSGSPCNNRCVNCYDGPAAAQPTTPKTVNRQLREGYVRGYRAVEVVGGEVLLDNRAEAIVLQARRLGYGDIAIETNARMLNLPHALERCARLALQKVVVRLNAGDEELHDEMARVHGAFRQTLNGIRALAQRGISVTVRVRRHPRNIASLQRARLIALRAGANRFEVIGEAESPSADE